MHYICNIEGLESNAQHVQVDDVKAMDITIVGGAAIEGLALFMADQS